MKSALRTSLPSNVGVLIVGGGILGCSVAYHLAKGGCRDVVLLERKKLTSGTTWHAAGLVGQLQGTRATTAFAKYCAEFLAELELETGQSTSFRKTGSLAVALHAERLAELRRKIDYARSLDVDAREISVEEIAERWPLLNMEGIVGGTYQPNDGWASSTDVTMALARGARAHGATIIEDVEVERAVVEDGRVLGAITSLGEISTGRFVNCGGMWAMELARRNGVVVANHACEHYYLVTEPIPDLPRDLPVLRVHDERTYYKEDAGKLLFGFMHGAAKPWGMAGIPRDFCFNSLPFAEADVSEEIEMAVNRVPLLGGAGIRTLFNGPESFTTDGHFILGEAPNVSGYFILAGMNSTGIQTGPGAGRALAQWISKGFPPSDLSEMDPARFEQFQGQGAYVQLRSPETLVRTYSMHWPGFPRESARGLRRSSLHAELQARGAFFGETIGWERPQWYAPTGVKPERRFSYGRENWFEYSAEEHRAVREAVGLIDMSSLGKLRIQGIDAESEMRRICSAETTVEPGRVVYSLWLNDRGGIEADVTVARLGARDYLVMGSTDRLPRDRWWLARNIARDAKVVVHDETTAYGVLAVAGPLSRELLSRRAEMDFSNAAFPFGTSREFYIGSALVRGQRISYAGELGYELFFTPDLGPYILQTLFDAGADLGVRLVGTEAVESLRLEKGYCHWGADISYADSPYEAGLSFLCRSDDGANYVGRGAYEARRSRPAAYRLCSLLLDDPELLLHGDEPILRDGHIVGWVTSGAYGHTLGGAIGLGIVAAPWEPSTRTEFSDYRYTVRVEGRDASVGVSLKGFYDPKGERLRS